MLTEEQVHYFHTFGFLILRQVLNADELGTIHVEFEREMERAYRHAPFDGSRRHWTLMMGSETPFFAGLLEDDRFCEAAEQLYGEDVFGTGSDANRYIGDTKWHPDTHSTHQYGVKFAYYLEPVGAESGALRVVPGSHRNPFHEELREARSASRLENTREVPAYVCESEPGDMVAFDLRTWHASCGGSKDRRMCTLVYYNNPGNPEEEETTREQGASNARTTAKFGRPDDPFYPPEWAANPQGSPRRQRWIDRMRELGFFDAVQA